MSEHAPARQPTCAQHLGKTAALRRLQVAIQESHNRTGIAELGFLRRGFYYLLNDWEDKFAHGYMRALQETLRGTEQDGFRNRLWQKIAQRAIIVARLPDMDFAGTEHEIEEIIADLNRLNPVGA